MSNSKLLQQICEPTVSGLYYVLGNLRSDWKTIGHMLKVDSTKLDAIEKDFTSLSRKMIEVFEAWINYTSRAKCQWSTIVSVLERIDEEKLARRVEEFTHAETPQSGQDFNWLRKEHCGKLGTQIREGDEHSIMDCLKTVANKWYEIGCLLHLQKIDLDEIGSYYKGFQICLIKMLTKAGKVGECTWEGLKFILEELNLHRAAENLDELIKKKEICMVDVKPKFRRMKHFISHKGEMYFEKIHKLLALSGVSNEEMLKNLSKYLTERRPAQNETILIFNCLKKIAKIDIHNTERCEEIIKELKADMKFAQKITKKIYSAKKLLESKEEEIKKVTRERSSEDQQQQKSQLISIQASLKDCMQQLERAKAEYDNIKGKLETCRDNLTAIKERLKAIKSSAQQWKRKTNPFVACAVTGATGMVGAGAGIAGKGTWFFGPGTTLLLSASIGICIGAIYSILLAQENPDLEDIITLCTEGTKTLEKVDHKLYSIIWKIDLDEPSIQRKQLGSLLVPMHILLAVINFIC